MTSPKSSPESEETKEAEASFEAVYERLEQTVARLESGGLPLEESIALYESGMRLAIRCQEMLEAAELRVTQFETALIAEIGLAAMTGFLI